MRLTCLVNSHNYGAYLGDAVRSALAGVDSFDEVIVVDDGSTDDSREVVEALARRDSRVRLIAKRNEGQLSCFNAGFEAATGDVVAFLDADDLYEPDYAGRLRDLYARRSDVDFTICGRRVFGAENRVVSQYPIDTDLGFSVGATLIGSRVVGGPTSCLSGRREVLARVLPAPLASEWRICADACLVYGSSLARARKYFLAGPLVRYRVHGQNRHYGQAEDAAASFVRRQKVAALVTHYARRFELDHERVVKLLPWEFDTIERPTLRMFDQYLRLTLASREPLTVKTWQAYRFARHLLASRRRGPMAAVAAPPVTPEAPAAAPRVHAA